MKPIFLEGSSFFVLFFVMVELRHVIDLSVSLTMSQPAETTEKLSVSGFEFLILVLQSSSGIDLIFLF